MTANSIPPTVSVQWNYLQEYLLRRGVELGSEKGQVVRIWLWEELHDDIVPSWEEGLEGATDIALALYDAFHAHFDELYMVEGGLGERWVKKFMRSRLGFAAEPLVEAVLSTIRDKRLHLLQAFRRKYQKSLFVSASFKPQAIQGYFRRVAELESLKAPLKELDRVTGRDWEALNRLPSPRGFVSDTEREIGDGGQAGDLASQARRVAAFWSNPKNGFTRAQYLEGMASLGLGWLTDEPVLAERCQAHLAGRLPAWTTKQQRLGDRVVRLLDRRGQWEAEYMRTRDPGARDRLATVQRRLDALQLRLSRHRDHLCPRPHEVAALLEDLVPQKVGGVRFQRINHEIAILVRRVEQGVAVLRTDRAPGLAQWPGLVTLIADVLSHSGGKPPPAGGHGLTERERSRRRRAHEDWHEVGELLLARVHGAIHALYHNVGGSSQALLDWLHDVQDLYELGILDRTGIVGGLKTRRGSWLNRLLRPDLEVEAPGPLLGPYRRGAPSLLGQNGLARD